MSEVKQRRISYNPPHGWLTISDYAERYGTTKTNIYTSFYRYKTEYGQYPKWYISVNDQISIVHEARLKRAKQMQDMIWSWNTEHFYWLMMMTFNSEQEMGRYLATHSRCFKSPNAWATWMGSAMWIHDMESVVPKNMTTFNKVNMHVEFLRISALRIGRLAKRYGTKGLIRLYEQYYYKEAK